MCTVTVNQDDAGFLVTMNRDEARSRGSEVSPKHHQPANTPDWLAPLDSDTGGTWMGVNEFGTVDFLTFMDGRNVKLSQLDLLK